MKSAFIKSFYRCFVKDFNPLIVPVIIEFGRERFPRRGEDSAHITAESGNLAGAPPFFCTTPWLLIIQRYALIGYLVCTGKPAMQYGKNAGDITTFKDYYTILAGSLTPDGWHIACWNTWGKEGPEKTFDLPQKETIYKRRENMKKILCMILLLAMALALVVPLQSYARGPRVRINAHIAHRGWGWWPWAVVGGAVVTAPYWYRPYYGPYYPPPPVVVQEPTPTYAEPEEQQPNYWYYCPKPQGYYPYVQSCQTAWMQVVPNPNPPPPGANQGANPGEDAEK